jgi:two-component system OmpR family response regulator
VRRGAAAEEPGDASASERIDAKIAELADWRGRTLARVRALIRRSSLQPTSALEIGDVTIDSVARTVTRAGEPVPLTAREYSLVEYLARHRGALVTRTELYDHLFDENDATLSNLLDVHVSNIRKKLGHEFIVTRRGHGYCVE